VRTFLVGLGLLAACGGGGGGEHDAGSPIDAGSQPTAAEIFDPTVVRHFELTVDPADWQWLNEHAQEETYVAADLRYGEDVVANLGVRYKGGFGTLGLCFDGTGQRTCPKLSLKLDFDQYVDGQRFAGLEHLNFHSMKYDPSQMKDRLAYGVFRAAGVPAPRSVHARIEVNGEDLGLFALIEAVDGEFVEDQFATIDGGEGNLFKEVWPVHTTEGPYLAALENNAANATADRMIRFATALAAADATTFRAVASAWMDLPTLVSFLAVDRLLDNWDGFVGWYCIGGPCFNHNFYWYEETGADRVWLLPWDMDNTMQVPSPIRDVYGMPDWNASTADCAQRTVFLGLQGLPPACDHLIGLMAEVLWPDYQARTAELLAGPASEATLEAEIAAMQALLLPEVMTDPYGPTVTDWQAAVADLRADLPTLRSRVAP
jgi:hypothetical protein